MAKKQIQVWSEGYACTGQSSQAILHGTFEADDFDDAVQQWLQTVPKEDYHYLQKANDGTWSYWACDLFDNEADARKSFG